MDKAKARAALRDVKPPSALVFERGNDAGYVIEVTNGQWERDPSQKTLIVHAFVKPGIPMARAHEVFQHALVDVFGEHPDNDHHVDYYDPAEFRQRFNTAPVMTSHTMTVIFAPGPVVYTRRPEFVRNAMIVAMRKWHDASASWSSFAPLEVTR